MTEHEQQELERLPDRKLRYVIDVGTDRLLQLAKELDDTEQRVKYAQQVLRGRTNASS